MQCGPSTCICENGTYLKSIVDTLIIVYIEVINTANTIPRNVMSTVSINPDVKNVTCEKIYCLIHTISLVTVCLLT